jgi:hypothetical protein
MDFPKLLAVSSEVKVVFFSDKRPKVKIETNCARLRQFVSTTFEDFEKCDEAYRHVEAAGWEMPDRPERKGVGLNGPYRVWKLQKTEVADHYTRDGREFKEGFVPSVSKRDIERLYLRGWTGTALRQVMKKYDETHARKLPRSMHDDVAADIRLNKWAPAAAIVAQISVWHK